MARLTKAEREELERQRTMRDAWDLAARLAAEEEERRRRENEEAAAQERNPFQYVQSGSSSVPATPQQGPWSGPAFNRAQDRQEDAGIIGDLVLSAAGTVGDIAAGVVDMLDPDPNALARDPSNPFHNALENLTDVGLRVPVQIDDAVRGVMQRLSLNASPEAVDAVMRTINPFGAAARDALLGREAAAEERVRSGDVDLERRGFVNELADSIRSGTAAMRQARSPEALAAEEGLSEAMDSGFVDTAKFLASGQGARALTQTIAGSAPYAALGFGAGRALSLAGASPAAATAGSGAVMFSNIATTQASEVENAIMSLTPEEAVNNPVINDLMSRGMSFEQAKRAAATEARFSTVASMVPTAPLYAMGVFERMGAGQSIRQSTLDTLQRIGARGAAQEAGQEFVQEASERYASNVGEIAGGTRSEEDRYQGVAGAGLVGSISGGALGAGGAVVNAQADFTARERALMDIADRLEQRAAARAAAREELEQAQFEEQVMERLAAQDAQRDFLRMPGQPVGQNAGRPTESFEAWAERESAPVREAEQAQADFISMPTTMASDQALRNSMREGPRGQVDRELPGTRAQRRAENERLAASVMREQAEVDQDMEAWEQEREQRLASEAEREAQLEEARQFDRQQTEQDLKNAKSRHASARREHLRNVQRANADKPEAERLEAIRQAMVEWDAANPAPTAVQAAAEALQRAPRRRAQAGHSAAPAAPQQLDVETMRAAGMTEEEIAQEQASAGEARPEDMASRIEALRQRTGGRRMEADSSASPDRNPADVIRAIAKRVGRGTDRRALAQEQLLLNGKLSIVSDEEMRSIAGDNTGGYYDGERMYINAAAVPEGREAASVLDLILTHEADHAARNSGNRDAISKSRMLLGDGATARLVQRLETDSHPVAQDARRMVERLGLDEGTNRAEYEDELIAYAITSAVSRNAGSTWAPIRGVVSAARRKWKEYTGSEDINLDDLAAYAQQTVEALAESRGDISAETEGRAQIAFHGTPHTFDPEEGAPLGRFRSSQRGTGEGAQAKGAGHYLTQQHGTADKRYRQRLVGNGVDPVWNTAKLALDDANGDIDVARRNMTESVKDFPSLQPVLDVLNSNTADRIQQEVENQESLDRGEVYYADIPEDNELANWDMPLDEQPENVRNAVAAVAEEIASTRNPVVGRYDITNLDGNIPFGNVYNLLSMAAADGPRVGDSIVSDLLHKNGIKGHIFSGRTDGPRNFVIYSDDDVRIVGRDQREAGQDRRSMEQWGEEIVNRPGSSTSLRRQWEEEARASVPNRFSGRAMRLADADDVKLDGQRRIRDAIRDKTPNIVLDAISVYGSAGEGLFDLNQDLENARNSIYQSALAFDARLSKAFAKAAEARGVSVEQLNNEVLKRIEAIGKIPNNTRKDNLIARIVQDYPELRALPEAIHAINSMTDRIINARLADPRPITEEELRQLEFMEANKYSYLTNIYAAFQGKAGKEYRDRLVKKHAIGMKAVMEGKEVPESVRREYQIYERALRFITANDVAVSDPEMLTALPIEQLEGLYDMWTTLGDSAEAVKVDMENSGTYDEGAYRDTLESRVAEWVAAADDGTTRRLAEIVLNNLLANHPLSGPAKRYARGGGLDESILQHRKDLPEPLADLYGKITDVPSLINATLVRQGELAEKLRFLTRLATESNERGMPYVVSKRDAADPRFSAYTVPLSGETYGPLNGMMTTPEVARMITDYSEGMVALADAMAVAGQTPNPLRKAASNKAVQWWTWAAGKQKAMKIITRPDYLLLNFAGSISTPVLTGGFTPQDFIKGVQLAAEHLSYTINPARDKEVSPELRLMLEMGVFDNAVTQEIRNTPRKMVEQVIRRMGSVQSMSDFHKLHAVKDAGDRLWNLLVEAYSLSDSWAKIPVGLARMRYLQDYYAANGDNVTNEQIVREAAKFVRDSTIGMQAVPAGVKGLERLGATFYAPYFYSAFRTLARAPINVWNDAKMAVDAKTPEARNIAARSAALKAAGTFMVYWGLGSVLKNFLEDMMDDDEREQLERDRALMFEQDAVGDLMPMGKDELGRRMYLVVSRMDQFGPATDIYRALRENDDPEKALGIVASGLYDLIITNRALGWAIDTAKDRERDTQTERVFRETTDWMKAQASRMGGSVGVQAVDALLDGIDLFMPAGVMNYFDPENKRPQDVDGQGRALVAGVMAALGHKFVIVDEGRAISSAAGELRDHRRTANRNINNTLESLGPRAAMEELLAAADRERQLVQKVGERYEAIVGSGTSPRMAMEMLKDAGLDATTIAAIRKQAYTSEADDWARRYSSVLSANALRNPPRPRGSMTPEQKKEWQREWKEQAKEVRRRLRTKSYYNDEDGDE